MWTGFEIGSDSKFLFFETVISIFTQHGVEIILIQSIKKNPVEKAFTEFPAIAHLPEGGSIVINARVDQGPLRFRGGLVGDIDDPVERIIPLVGTTGAPNNLHLLDVFQD